MCHKLKGNASGQFFSLCDIPYTTHSGYGIIFQLKRTQLNIDTECKSVTHIGHDQPVVDHMMLKKNMAYKHDIPHKGLYANNQACNNGTFILQWDQQLT